MPIRTGFKLRPLDFLVASLIGVTSGYYIFRGPAQGRTGMRTPPPKENLSDAEKPNKKE